MTEATPTPHPLDPVPETGEPRVDALHRLLAIVDRLRAPDGCPWDREQTISSMAPSLIEEAHELVEAIESKSETATIEEAGDLLMVIFLICRIAQDEQRFDLGAAATAVGDKLVRRHPHVFGDVEVTGSEHVIANWEKIKAAERTAKEEDASALAGIPSALPALQRAARLGAKAVAAGFKWESPEGALAKVEEEIRELRVAYESGDRAHLEAELGDLLMATSFFASYVDVDAERATREALRRFESRFRAMEASLGPTAREATLAQWMAAWHAAKAAE